MHREAFEALLTTLVRSRPSEVSGERGGVWVGRTGVAEGVTTSATVFGFTEVDIEAWP